MITHSDLIQLGYKYLYFRNNRDFYDKAGFKIILHQGEVAQLNTKRLPKCPYVNNCSSLENLFKQWAITRVKQLCVMLPRLEQQKINLINLLKYV